MPRIEATDRDRIGQVIVPIPLSAIELMTTLQLVETYAPLALATAKEQGGTLVGDPEVLRLEEILPRMADADPALLEAVKTAERSAFLVATMVPHDWTSFDRGDVRSEIEYVAPPAKGRRN